MVSQCLYGVGVSPRKLLVGQEVEGQLASMGEVAMGMEGKYSPSPQSSASKAGMRDIRCSSAIYCFTLTSWISDKSSPMSCIFTVVAVEKLRGSRAVLCAMAS